MQHDGSEIIQEKLQPALKTLRELSEQHQDDPEFLLLLRRDLKPSTEASRTMRFGQAFRNRPKLFALLETMDRSSGWPSIARLQLRTFIDLLEQDPADMAA